MQEYTEKGLIKARCKMCGKKMIYLIYASGKYAVTCKSCDTQTYWYESEQEALKAEKTTIRLIKQTIPKLTLR